MLNNKVLLTGVAGFIGFHLAKRLLSEGYHIIGVDNLNDYYDVQLKNDRLAQIPTDNFIFYQLDIADKDALFQLFEAERFDYVVNLAAQAGVRYSIDNPDSYMRSNMIGFYNVLEACRHYPVKHLVYASSSSVYGANKKVPFEESDPVDNPVSLYAATKKSNELMAYTYSHLYKIPSSGLRFFTVYGPWGRPDMAYFGFADRYFKGEPIHVFNNGDFDNDLYRDFTYVDDIVEGIARLLPYKRPQNEDGVDHEVYNIGNNQPVKLMAFINALENTLSTSLGQKIEFEKIYEPMKPGDVPATYASTQKLEEAVGYKPSTTIKSGLQAFADWYVEYYGK